ncbi:MAG TPA: hypothetical protein VK934_05420 [Fimbriimonas sp.]|nr:hypothetical protein [Fimbriimonas sp.]
MISRLAIVAGVAALSQVSLGQATSSASKPVTVTIASYISVTFVNTASLDFLIEDGGAAGKYQRTANYTVKSNVNYNVSCSYVKPVSATATPAPGVFTAFSDLDPNVQPPTAGTTGKLTLRISGLTYTSAVKGVYDQGGSVTVTVIEAG